MCPNTIEDNSSTDHALVNKPKAGKFDLLLSLIKIMLISTFFILLIEFIAYQPSPVKTAVVDALIQQQGGSQ